MEETKIVEQTRQWIREIVIGLNLCPFAQRVFDGDRIRYVVSDSKDEASLLDSLRRELLLLAGTPIQEIETTILIHPAVLADFGDYNEFIGPAEELLEELDLVGIVQLATFHPEYQFAGTKPSAVENYTNRSPYPMLHLLREASISAVATDADELLAIPKRNVQTLRQLGLADILQRMKKIKKAD